MMLLAEVVEALQVSITPVIFISGVGLVILSMTNRFARVIDRARALSRLLPDSTGDNNGKILAELKILITRVKLTRIGISCAVIAIFLISLIIICLFVGFIYKIDIALVVVSLFFVCTVSLTCSLFVFIWDTHLSLKALWLAIPEDIR